jgi:hypothetical protein
MGFLWTLEHSRIIKITPVNYVAEFMDGYVCWFTDSRVVFSVIDFFSSTAFSVEEQLLRHPVLSLLP